MGKPQDTELRLFLTGDVMLGRGVDQVRATACPPELYETYVKDARTYVELAERANGPMAAPVGPDYVWGDAAADVTAVAPDLRVINLETAVTARGRPWPGKSIHYRMHPDNVDALAAFDVAACTLANNHVLDWSAPGLMDTLDTLARADIPTVGAGRDAESASRPAILDVAGGRAVRLYGACLEDSGVPAAWQAGEEAGVHWLGDGAGNASRRLCERIERAKYSGDIVVVSLHWGGNWGYAVPDVHRDLAYALIDAGADVIHGHSGHHPKGVGLYRDRLILYGCGDFVNDYEGIGGHEDYRPDLVAGFLVDLDADGRCVGLTLLPYRLRRLALTRSQPGDADWLADRLSAENPQADVVFDPNERGEVVLRVE